MRVWYPVMMVVFTGACAAAAAASQVYEDMAIDLSNQLVATLPK